MDNRTWEDALKEVINLYKKSWSVRKFFARIITTAGDGANIEALWEQFRDDMLPPAKRRYANDDDALEHYLRREEFALRHIAYLVDRYGGDIATCGIDVSHVDLSHIHAFDHYEQRLDTNGDVIIENINFDLDAEARDVITDADRQAALDMERKLHPEQLEVFDAIMGNFPREIHLFGYTQDSVIHMADPNPMRDRLVFVHGRAGTGKTTLIETVVNAARANMGLNVVFAAYTGIAANLIKGGSTVHSTFGLKVGDESSFPQIRPDDVRGRRLAEADIIIIDEVTMMPKACLEGIDKILQDLRGNRTPFGGVVFVLVGDFHQTLPVVTGAPPIKAIEKCVKTSVYYDRFKHFYLVHNHRARSSEVEYVVLLEKVGKGHGIDARGTVALPAQLFVKTRQELLDFVFDGDSVFNKEELKQRAVLSSLNEICMANCHYLRRKLNRPENREFTLLATDDRLDTGNVAIETNVDAFNALLPSGLPPYKLTVRIGEPVMLIRNISTRDGLTNGTRMVITDILGRNNSTVRCHVLTGPAEGMNEEFAPCYFSHADEKNPNIRFKRFQFPFRPTFCMTDIKSQGQTLTRVGIDRTSDAFMHGQDYVALSRCRTMDSIRIYQPADRYPSLPDDPPNTIRIKNIVFQQVLNDER